MACIMTADHSAALTMLQQIDEQDLYDHRHRLILEALQSLRTDNKSFDMVSVVVELRDNGDFERSDGLREYVEKLPDQTPSPANWPTWHGALKDHSARRVILANCAKLEELCRDASADATSLGQEVQRFAAYTPAANGKLFNLWRPSQILAWVEPQGSHFLLPSYLTKGGLTTVIGQGGVGKSRLTLWLALCQISGRSWCDLQTAGEPTKWLFLGDENSIARWKHDLERMLPLFTPAEVDKIDALIRLPAPVSPDDCDVWLGDPTTQNRLANTIRTECPGVVVVDPFANFAPGDINKPGEMKESLRLLLGLIQTAAPNAAIQLLHHARTGRVNISQGIGWDAANFGLGGKALFASSRCVINLMPGKSDDDTRLVLHCAKANNCPRFETRGLIFDPKTFAYNTDPSFDAEGWLADVEGRARSGQSLCTVFEVTSAVSDGYTTTKDLVTHLTEACATTKRTVERVIQRAVKCEAIKPFMRGKFILGKKSATFIKPT